MLRMFLLEASSSDKERDDERLLAIAGNVGLVKRLY